MQPHIIFAAISTAASVIAYAMSAYASFTLVRRLKDENQPLYVTQIIKLPPSPKQTEKFPR